MSAVGTATGAGGWRRRAKAYRQGVVQVYEDLYRFRPRFEDRRFWAVQALVLLIAGAHTTLEILHRLGYPMVVGSGPTVSLMSFIPVSLFFIPVVYAALNFGFAGAVATAVWCSLLTIPNVALHVGVERIRETLQMSIVDSVAVFVGMRVEREVAARDQAEAATAALQVSEAKYRGLFETSPVAVLVLDRDGVVRDANPAAGKLLSRPEEGLPGSSIGDLLGADTLARLHGGGDGEALQEPLVFSVKRSDGSERRVQPVATSVQREEDEPELQVLLVDVTLEEQRQAGLRALTARILRAQEEERKRIAQELHDETIQNLILLCRRLDAVAQPPPQLPKRVLTEITEARLSAERTVAGLRNFARLLRPPTLDDLGLVTSVWRLVTDLSERTRVDARLIVTGQERRLASEDELGLFRIVQEALRNVERHAEASQVFVTITFEERGIYLEVRDNGKGFSLPALTGDFSSGKQLGLLGMRERAQLLGGDLRIQSAVGAGTTVTISCPTIFRT